jgi:hypothetical protein
VEEGPGRGDVRNPECDGCQSVKPHGLDKLDHVIDNCNP